jgi:hypothetical protein
MEGLKKKGNMKKSKANKEGMELEEELVDYEHINKEQDFQTVTFDFLEPDHKHQGSLYNLMKKSFNFVTWDIYALFDAICEQNELGIFLAIAPEEDEVVEAENTEIYGLLSIVNFKLLETGGFLERLTKFVLASASAESQHFLNSIFIEKPEKTGLLVNDRVINLPNMVVPNIFEQFMEDKRFIDAEYEIEEQAMYNFDFVVYFVPCYFAQDTKKSVENESHGSLLYYKQEDRHLAKKAIYSQEISHKMSEEFRLMMIVLKYEDFLFMVASKSIFN